MQVPIKSIVVKERVRKELGDLTPLMNSMKQHGQMNPVLITREYELIAGHRRLSSATRLGWSSVEAVFTDSVTDVEKLEIELEENVHRKDLSPSELLEGYKRLEKLRKPGLFARLKRFFSNLFGRLFKRQRPSRQPVPADAGQPGAAGTQGTSGTDEYAGTELGI
jgi:ParB family chromosome partitioning protein